MESRSTNTTPSRSVDFFPQGRPAEFTAPAVILALVLSVVMGAANVYLGLKAGITVSASIPAAVIAMGIFQGILRRKSILESNLVQTAASAGESLAAGIIFTMPALILIGYWKTFDFWTTTLVALSGGLLGILFMIPMRRVFVVGSPELKYPEGVACAEVLRAGEEAGEGHDAAPEARQGIMLVGLGIALGVLFKLAISQLQLLRGAVAWAGATSQRVFYFGADLSPALLAVGYIVGLGIAVQIFLGGAIGWLVAIPLLGMPEPGFHETGFWAGTSYAGASQAGISPLVLAEEVWLAKVRYIGVGAMVLGGLTSIWRVRGGLRAAVVDMVEAYRGQGPQETDVTERNLRGSTLVGLALFSVGLAAAVYYGMLNHNLGFTILATSVMLVMAVFFTAVASYIVGLVGNSNSPVSGMTITAVLGTGGMIMLFGYTGMDAMVATLGVAGIICCVACTSGDVCNDLKTGYLIGASPRYQQIMQVLGVVVAAFVMQPVLYVLTEGSLAAGTGGIGGSELSAPQAVLFAALAKGLFGDGDLPWNMVGIGALLGVALLIADFFLRRAGSRFRLYVMPVAVGAYLPFEVSVPILLGGIVHYLVTRRKGIREDQESSRDPGILLTSGMIAGESLTGVALGTLAWLGVAKWNVAASLTAGIANPATANAIMEAVSLGVFLALAAWVYRVATRG